MTFKWNAGQGPFMVALIPEEVQVNRALAKRLMAPDKEYDLAMPQKLLVEAFARHEIQTLDLLPAFQASERRLYLNDSHWSPKGHELAARLLLDVVLPWADPFARCLSRDVGGVGSIAAQGQ